MGQFNNAFRNFFRSPSDGLSQLTSFATDLMARKGASRSNKTLLLSIIKARYRESEIYMFLQPCLTGIVVTPVVAREVNRHLGGEFLQSNHQGFTLVPEEDRLVLIDQTHHIIVPGFAFYSDGRAIRPGWETSREVCPLDQPQISPVRMITLIAAIRGNELISQLPPDHAMLAGALRMRILESNSKLGNQSLFSQVIDRDKFNQVLIELGHLAIRDGVVDGITEFSTPIFNRIQSEGITLDEWQREVISNRAREQLEKELGFDPGNANSFSFLETGVRADGARIRELRGAQNLTLFVSEAFDKYVIHYRPVEELYRDLWIVLEENYRAYKEWVRAPVQDDPRFQLYDRLERCIEERRSLFSEWQIDFEQLRHGVNRSLDLFLE